VISRRSAVALLGGASVRAFLGHGQPCFISPETQKASESLVQADSPPALLPGEPMSPERMSVIEEFQKNSEGLEKKYEAHALKSDWTMPYRLFRPSQSGKLPLVVYLHGSGGQGDDNEKQLQFGNTFGTRVWLLPQNQREFPCYVVAPQTDRGWVRYDAAQLDQGVVKMIPGFGEGCRLALEVVDELVCKLPIDDRRIYVTGQSMGGGGVWNMTAFRKNLFAAAAPLCGSITLDDPAQSAETPFWVFHGDSDDTVPPAASRDRVAALRKAGARPLYTEYAGVDHEVWRWAYTEPALVHWMFSQRRSS